MVKFYFIHALGIFHINTQSSLNKHVSTVASSTTVTSSLINICFDGFQNIFGESLSKTLYLKYPVKQKIFVGFYLLVIDKSLTKLLEPGRHSCVHCEFKNKWSRYVLGLPCPVFISLLFINSTWCLLLQVTLVVA